MVYLLVFFYFNDYGSTLHYFFDSNPSSFDIPTAVSALLLTIYLFKIKKRIANNSKTFYIRANIIISANVLLLLQFGALLRRAKRQ